MTVEEHYATLLQLPPPWEVVKVEESLPEKRRSRKGSGRFLLVLRKPEGQRQYVTGREPTGRELPDSSFR